MNNSQKSTSTAAAGATAGAVAGSFIPGVGTLAGMTVGAAAGGLMGDVLFPQETEEIPGASGAERQMLGIQSQAAEKALSLNGLSAKEMSGIGQIGRETQQLQAEKIASLPMSMSALDKQRMGKMLLAQTRKTQETVTEKISSYDAKSEMRNIAMATDISAQASRTAAQVRAAEVMKRQYENQERKNQAMAFNQSVKGMIGAIGTGFDLAEKQQKAEALKLAKGQSTADMALDNDFAEMENELLVEANAQTRMEMETAWADEGLDPYVDEFNAEWGGEL